MLDEKVIDEVGTPAEELDYILPEGYVEEEEAQLDGEETEEEPTTTEDETESTDDTDEESTDEEEEEAVEPLENLELKVLKEVKKLSDIPREELQSMLQKGGDYDRVKDKLGMAQGEVDEWKEISDMFDLTPSQVREALKEQHFKSIAEDQGRHVDDVRKVYEANRKSENDKMYDRFADKHPDVKIDSLPQEVLESVKNGRDLLKVYDEYTNSETIESMKSEIDDLKKQLEGKSKAEDIKKQNTKSKKKGVIKPTSNSGDVETDDFLAGLNGDY